MSEEEAVYIENLLLFVFKFSQEIFVNIYNDIIDKSCLDLFTSAPLMTYELHKKNQFVLQSNNFICKLLTILNICS